MSSSFTWTALLRSLSEDLSQEIWSMRLLGVDDINVSGRRVCCAVALNTEEARKGLLKSREDIIARLTKLKDQQTTLGVLLMVSAAAPTHGALPRVDLFDLRQLQYLATHGDLLTLRNTKHELHSIILPGPSRGRLSDGRFWFHTSTGHLYQHRDEIVLVHDIFGSSSASPHQLVMTRPVQSVMTFSPSSIIFSQDNTISVLDYRFNCLLGTVSVAREVTKGSSFANSDPEDRNREETQLLTYLSGQGILVALRDRELLTLRLQDDEFDVHLRRKRKRGTLLIEAFGRGRAQCLKALPEDSTGHLVHKSLSVAPSLDVAWEGQKSMLDSLWEAGDTEAFDAHVEKWTVLPTGTRQKNFAGIEMRSHHCRANYLLQKLFSWRSPGLSGAVQHERLGLCLGVLPPKTFEWLIEHAVLSVYHVEFALKQLHPSTFARRLSPCAMVEALASYDSSLHTLMVWLTSSTLLLAQELTYAIRLALIIIKQAHSQAGPSLITNGSDERTVVVHQDLKPAEEVDQGHEHEWQSLPETNADKIHDAEAVMSHSLQRLSSCHRKEVHEAFRQQLSRPDLISLIDYLRSDLASGGWLSRYVDDDGVSAPAHDQQMDQMTITAVLMNCAIDCLGSSTWLLGSPGDNRSSEKEAKVTYMKAEISAALEGIEEAAYLEGMLHEVLLFSNTIPQTKMVTGSSSTSMMKNRPMIISVDRDGTLPIGRHHDVSATKVGIAGEVESRSKRDIGRLKSMQVGAYSFERIQI